jgi:integrase
VSTNGKGGRYKGVYRNGESWYYSVVVGKHPDGRPKRQLRRGFKTAKAADQARRGVQKSIETGTYVEPSKETVAEFFGAWLEASRASLRPSTWASYDMNVRANILPELGAIQLQRLTPDRLNALYAKLLGRGLSPATVRYVHVLLHGALDDAFRWGRVLRNVAKLANPPARRQGRSKMKTWTKEELGAFLAHVQGTRLYPPLLLAATTGMRRGEVLGLHWRDVDLEAGRVSITRTLILVDDKPQFSEPKTDSGSRTVPIPHETVAALRAWRLAQEPNMTDLVFTDDGGPVHPGHFSKAFNAVARKAGLPRIRFHDLRHTWATLALGAGVPLKVVSEILGHSSLAITGDLYSHVSPGMMEGASDTVAAAIFGRSESTG